MRWKREIRELKDEKHDRNLLSDDRFTGATLTFLKRRGLGKSRKALYCGDKVTFSVTSSVSTPSVPLSLLSQLSLLSFCVLIEGYTRTGDRTWSCISRYCRKSLTWIYHVKYKTTNQIPPNTDCMEILVLVRYVWFGL